MFRTPRGVRDGNVDGSRGKAHSHSLGARLVNTEPYLSDVDHTSVGAHGALEKNLALYKFLSGKFPTSFDGAATQPDWESAPSRLKYVKRHDLRTISRTITHVNPREVEGIEALLEANLMQVYGLSTIGRCLVSSEATSDLLMYDYLVFVKSR